jgi:DNA polymerase V
MNFTATSETQLSFFENSDPRHRPLMNTIDNLNLHFGRNSIKFASQDLSRKSNTKQLKVSPSYATKLSDIIKIKV